MITNPYTSHTVRIRVCLAPELDDMGRAAAHMLRKEAVREVVRALNAYAYTG